VEDKNENDKDVNKKTLHTFIQKITLKKIYTYREGGE
jgi:hypothetical protein